MIALFLSLWMGSLVYSAVLHDFCAFPPEGCASVQAFHEDCTVSAQFLGCRFNLDTAACEGKQECLDNTKECGWKSVTLDAASRMLPGCLNGGDETACHAQRLRAYRALEIDQVCDGGAHPPVLTVEPPRPGGKTNFDVEFFVDVKGADAATSSGSKDTPFETLPYALERSREFSKSTKKHIVILGGTHRVFSTLELTAQDSYLTIEGKDGALLSGAQVMEPSVWRATADGEAVVMDISPRQARTCARSSGPFPSCTSTGSP
jgi:hypothetical protein